jgi:hypothetical protein
MKKLTAILLLISATVVKAQNTTSHSFSKLNFFSSIGLGLADNDFKPASGNSVQTATGLEWQLASQSSIGAGLAFDNYGYEKTGTGYSLDSKLKATNLGVFYRFKIGTSRWRPYLKAGGGVAWLTVPVVTVAPGITSIKREVETVGFALGEAGVQAHVFSRYSLLFGAERDWFGKAALLDNTNLRTTTVKIGVISAF